MPDPIFAPIAGPIFTAPELPTYESLMDCIRCGRCLPVCPTYQQTTLETQSPRGRLSLLRAVEDGKLDFDDPGVEEHMYHCLDCRACNTVCPAGIPIGELIVEGRAAVEVKHPRSWLIRFVLNHALISPRRIEWFAWPLRLAQQLKLDKLMLFLFGWIPFIRDLMQMAPSMAKPLWGELTLAKVGRENSQSVSTPSQGLPRVNLAKGSRMTKNTSIQPFDGLRAGSSQGAASKYRVGFFLGCVMNVAFSDASRASVQLLKQLGCEVVTPKSQVCCGAPQDDQGLKDQARKMAKCNIEAFEQLGELDAIVADCAACSGFLKEYAHVLHSDPRETWAERADRFSAKVKDVTEWLDQIMPNRSADFNRQPTLVGTTITYHEPCHLANVQGVRRQPRALMMRLKNTGCDVRDLSDPTRCCGSAGIYNLTHSKMSKELLDRKMIDIAATGAETVVSANPGCLLQLQWGARRTQSSVEVKHITQVLLESMTDIMSNE
jgi:glycolate oxidase iron-sulfur subunit